MPRPPTTALRVVQVVPARAQMGSSLGFHIILACLAIALPAVVMVAHYRGLRHGDEDALRLARRWSRVLAVLVAVGAVSGTVLSFDMGLLWPGLMGRYGSVIGIPFSIEGIFFLLEAVFTAIYLYGWDRLPAWAHFWSLVPVALTGIGGALSVVAANSWMNAPAGFTQVHGRITRAVSSQQPVKFASMEYVARTARGVTEWIGGIWWHGHVVAGIPLPDVDSLLVGFSPHTRVTGWDSVPPALRPPLPTLIHLSFDLMVVIGFLMLLWGLWLGFWWWRRRDLPSGRLGTVFFAGGTLSGIACVAAMEAGWVVTEVGRQPWTVYGVLRTSQAATTASGVTGTLAATLVIYGALTVATLAILRLMQRRWQAGGARAPETQSPYTPPSGRPGSPQGPGVPR